MKTCFIAITFVVSCVVSARSDITLKVADAKVPAGREADVAVLISGSKSVGPLQFLVEYDPRLLEAVAGAVGEDPKGVRFGKVAGNGMIAEDLSSSGEWRLALRTDEPITQDGELLRLRFKIRGKKGESCTLRVDAAEAWEKESLQAVGVKTQPGTLNIVASSLPWWTPLATIIAAVLLSSLVLLVRRGKKTAEIRPTPPALPGQERPQS
jgi:hypothetical protein